jgi:hypothetical protein
MPTNVVERTDLKFENSTAKKLEASMSHQKIEQALRIIFEGIQQLQNEFPQRAFTIDGRLVGDVGEVIAELKYDLKLDDRSRPVYDAVARGNRQVQIKAGFGNSLTFRQVPDYYLGLKLYRDGGYEEVFNGPGRVIAERYKKRQGIGDVLLSFPIAELQRLSKDVAAADRIPLRTRT